MLPPAEFVLVYPHRLKRGYYCPPHIHDRFELVFHPSGRGMTGIDGQPRIPFAPGDAVLYIPNEAHDQLMEADGFDHCIQFRVHDRRLAEKIGGRRLIRNIRSLAVRKELEDMAPWQEEDAPAAKDLRLSALLFSLLWEAERKETEVPDPGFRFAGEARKILAAELGAPPSLKELARRLGISGDYLRHLFRKHFGVGIKEFSLERRLEKAQELLLHSPLRLKEIADACGFANERAFCTAFKARAGATPGEFKRR